MINAILQKMQVKMQMMKALKTLMMIIVKEVTQTYKIIHSQVYIIAWHSTTTASIIIIIIINPFDSVYFLLEEN